MVVVIRIKIMKCWLWYNCGKYGGKMINVKIFERHQECILVFKIFYTLNFFSILDIFL